MKTTKTMKTILIVILCLSLAASLAACAGEKSATTEKPASAEKPVTTEKPATTEAVSGGWSTGDPTELTEEQKALFEKATATLTGVDYTPVLYLGTQVVAGYNHRILCKAQAVVPDAPESWVIVEIYEAPDGKAEITNVLDVSAEEAAKYGVEIAAQEPISGGMQIANPFVDCDSFDAAKEIAGFAINAPETVDGYPERMIQAVENDMIQVFYTDGDLAEEGTPHVLLRKAVGIEDVSGDYNEYASVREQEVNGLTVTLKGDGKLSYLATWTDGSYSYSVSVSNGMTEDAILTLVNSLN